MGKQPAAARSSAKERFTVVSVIFRVAVVLVLTAASTALIVRIRGVETNHAISPIVTTGIALFFAATYGLIAFAVL